MVLRWILEVAPILVFVACYRLSDFFTATAALMTATILVTVIGYVHERRLARFPLLYGGKVVLFGALTLAFHETGILMVMDTLTSGGFALLLLVSLSMDRLVLKSFFSPLFAVSDPGWRIMTRRWAWFFVLHAAANEVVRNAFSEQAWVSYKAALIPVLAAVGFWQLLACRRHRLAGESNAWGIRTADAPAPADVPPIPEPLEPA